MILRHRLAALTCAGVAVAASLCTTALTDPEGKVLDTAGTSLELETTVPGTYRVQVSADLAGSDPDTVDSDSVNGRVVFEDVVQLKPID